MDETFRSLAASGVEVADTADVRAYLDRYSDIHEGVRAVCATARKTFGPDAALILSVYHDPEIVDQWLKLKVRPLSRPANLGRILDTVTAAHEELLWDKEGTITLTY